MSYLSVPDHWPLEGSVHAQDGRLGRVDDGGAEERAKHSSVRDGESAAVHVLNKQKIACLSF